MIILYCEQTNDKYKLKDDTEIFDINIIGHIDNIIYSCIFPFHSCRVWYAITVPDPPSTC